MSRIVIRTKVHIHKGLVRWVCYIDRNDLILETYIVMYALRMAITPVKYIIYIYICNSKTCKHNTNAENVR